MSFKPAPGGAESAISSSTSHRSHTDPAAAKSSAGGRGVFTKYLAVVIGSGLAALAVFYLTLSSLSFAGRLPPPAISNSLCIDEKLEDMRREPPGAAKVMVIGSSVAWRGFDAAAVEKAHPTSAPYNAGFCGLSANQTLFVTDWLLDRTPSVREVVLLAVPQDFEDCTGKKSAIFDREDADHFVYGHAWRWGYYLRYFDPISLGRNASEIAAKRSGQNTMDPLVFDRYGSGPMNTDASRDLTYTAVPRQDPACFRALRNLSARLQREHRRLVIVAMPLHPDWKARYDPQGRIVTAFTSGLSAIPNAEFWNADAASIVETSAFTDAIHMRWSAVKGFSDTLVKTLNIGGGPALEDPFGDAASLKGRI